MTWKLCRTAKYSAPDGPHVHSGPASAPRETQLARPAMTEPGSPGASWPGRTLRFLPTDTRRTVNVRPAGGRGGGSAARMARPRSGRARRAPPGTPAPAPRPVTISRNGEPVAALINIDDLADLQDRAALAAHLADKAAGRDGISLDELDAALDRIDAETLS